MGLGLEREQVVAPSAESATDISVGTTAARERCGEAVVPFFPPSLFSPPPPPPSPPRALERLGAVDGQKDPWIL